MILPRVVPATLISIGPFPSPASILLAFDFVISVPLSSKTLVSLFSDTTTFQVLVLASYPGSDFVSFSIYVPGNSLSKRILPFSSVSLLAL